MADRVVKIGIIGCGGIANAKHMPALKKLDNVQMVAFCDIEVERAQKAAEKFGAEGAKVYADYKELLKDASIEAVHVLTPNNSHSPISIDAMEAGKHVMCEKPMAKTYAEAKAMLDAHKRTGKILTIGYQNRFRAESMAMKRAAGEGMFGDIYFAKAHALRRRGVPTWGVFIDEEKQGGGPLIDIGTHALDLTLWIMDNYEPAVVLGSTFKKLGDQKETGNVFGDWKPEEFTTEDSAFGFIKMKNGATIILESGWALNIANSSGEAKTTICGTKAGADMEGGLRVNSVEFGKQYIKEYDLSTGGVAFFSGSSADPGDLEAKAWVDSLINGTDVVAKPEQALVVTQILEAIYTSSKTGKAVEF